MVEKVFLYYYECPECDKSLIASHKTECPNCQIRFDQKDYVGKKNVELKHKPHMN